MTDAAVSATPDIGSSLRHAWQQRREQNPSGGVRAATTLIRVSEAQRVASDCGYTATLYDHMGNTIALFYSQRKPGQPENPAWRALVTMLPTAGTAP
ncbi:MAG: hypothetical protein H6974_15260 [Gammaproteobacteria bacterium]|nr:hypothetical protein [Gammaproteobacteria bacterium]